MVNMRRLFYIIRQTAYSVFSFCYFIFLAIDMTIRGFFLITVCGATKEHKKIYHRILQRKARFVINHVPGTTFTYNNPHRESFETPSLIISNHQSHLDLMAIMMLTPNLIILTKNWVWHNPFYGIVIRYADFFPISDTEQMVKKIANKVKEGYSVMIFPEGTRSEDCHIRRFHRGAFYLAEKIGLDIVPVFIDGFGEVLPKKSFHLHPGDMSMEVLPRIRRTDFSFEGDYRVMTKRMRDIYIEKRNEKMRNHR